MTIIINGIDFVYHCNEPLSPDLDVPHQGLLHLLLDKLVARLEALLGRKRFSQLGGLQLERDTRMLLSGLQELSSR